MAARWDKLILLLKQTLQIYQAILNLSQKKRDILTEVKPQELEKLTKQEEVLIIEAGKVETARLALMEELVAGLALSTRKTTLTMLIAHAEPEIAGQLRDISKELARVTNEIVKLNELNARLIQQSLDFINYNINVISQSAVGPTYAAKGHSTANEPKRFILDAKV